MSEQAPPEPTPDHPPGEYAIVELFGHTTLVGRIAEVERFGARMLALEPIFRGALLPAVMHGGAAIYRLTPCSAVIAFERAPREAWQLPPAIRSVAPADLIEAAAAPQYVPADDEGGGDDDDSPF
jgi:hypothetical protein